jgi:hypothetical protein
MIHKFIFFYCTEVHKHLVKTQMAIFRLVAFAYKKVES